MALPSLQCRWGHKSILSPPGERERRAVQRCPDCGPLSSGSSIRVYSPSMTGPGLSGRAGRSFRVGPVPRTRWVNTRTCVAPAVANRPRLHAANARLSGAIRSAMPTVSPIKPGKMSKAPAKNTSAPSATDMTGASPRARLWRARVTMDNPCRFRVKMPRIADPTTIASVAGTPIRWPTQMSTASSSNG